jgi:hypothetical protein
MTSDSPKELPGLHGASREKDFVTRYNHDMEAIVDEGLTLLETHGLEYASVYLSANMVPLAIARRALLNPPQRRGKVH